MFVNAERAHTLHFGAILHLRGVLSVAVRQGPDRRAVGHLIKPRRLRAAWSFKAGSAEFDYLAALDLGTNFRDAQKQIRDRVRDRLEELADADESILNECVHCSRPDCPGDCMDADESDPPNTTGLPDALTKPVVAKSGRTVRVPLGTWRRPE